MDPSHEPSHVAHKSVSHDSATARSLGSQQMNKTKKNTILTNVPLPSLENIPTPASLTHV